MKFLILRKRRLWKRAKREKICFDDIEAEIIYVLRVWKKIRQEMKNYHCVLSVDFEEFFKKPQLMKLFPKESFDKIASRHGGVNREVLEVKVDVLNEENAEILTALALDARYVVVHSDLKIGVFDFLCESAGVCPEFAKGDFKENLVVCLGDEFLIKHLPTCKTYYDILPTLPEEFNEYFLPEGNMIFSEYIKANYPKKQNVKIRELMSK